MALELHAWPQAAARRTSVEGMRVGVQYGEEFQPGSLRLAETPTYLSLPCNCGQCPLVWVQEGSLIVLLSGSSLRGWPMARMQCRERGVRPGTGTSAVGSQLQQDLCTSMPLHLRPPHAPHINTHTLGSKSLPRAPPDSSRSLLSTASLSLSYLPPPCRQSEALCCHIFSSNTPRTLHCP